MAKVLFALIVSLMVLFVALHYALKTDMTMPYLATLLLAAVSAAVIFMEANRNRRDMALEERKLTKAISLLNRVKIKYVNNASMLEYDCEKYGVKMPLILRLSGKNIAVPGNTSAGFARIRSR